MSMGIVMASTAVVFALVILVVVVVIVSKKIHGVKSNYWLLTWFIELILIAPRRCSVQIMPLVLFQRHGSLLITRRSCHQVWLTWLKSVTRVTECSKLGAMIWLNKSLKQSGRWQIQVLWSHLRTPWLSVARIFSMTSLRKDLYLMFFMELRKLFRLDQSI